MLLAEEAGLQAEQIAYRGETPMLQDILSGAIMAASIPWPRPGR